MTPGAAVKPAVAAVVLVFVPSVADAVAPAMVALAPTLLTVVLTVSVTVPSAFYPPATAQLADGLTLVAVPPVAVVAQVDDTIVTPAGERDAERACARADDLRCSGG